LAAGALHSAGAARCEAEAEIIERSFNVLSGFDEADGQR
jgi:hypothetical protein